MRDSLTFMKVTTNIKGPCKTINWNNKIIIDNKVVTNHLVINQCYCLISTKANCKIFCFQKQQNYHG